MANYTHLLNTLVELVGALGVISGLILIASSCLHGRVRSSVLKWLQTDLDKPYYIERLIYHHHRVLGVIMMSAAALWLWLLSPMTALQKFISLTSEYISRIASSAFTPVLSLSLLALCILVVGLLLTMRPSALRPLETKVNNWFRPSSNISAKPRKIGWVDMLLDDAPLLTGFALLIAGLSCLWMATTH